MQGDPMIAAEVDFRFNVVAGRAGDRSEGHVVRKIGDAGMTTGAAVAPVDGRREVRLVDDPARRGVAVAAKACRVVRRGGVGRPRRAGPGNRQHTTADDEDPTGCSWTPFTSRRASHGPAPYCVL